MKTVFRVVRELTNKWAAKSDVINDKNGSTLTEEDDIKQRWAEYSSTLYQRRPGDVLPVMEVPEIKEPLPLKSEVEQALRQIKSGKDPGVDDLPIEIWKATGEVGVELLWRLCIKIWTCGEWPSEWCRAIFLPLPKKGNLKECSNYRTISLIVHASKILLKVIVGRLKMKYREIIPEEQAGFVEGRGTREQIVNIRILIEKFRECNIPLYMCFIDYSKAFDCVNHNKLWSILVEMGFPPHLVALMARLYEDQQSAVRTSVGDTEWFSIERGVRQGCVLSPFLFNIYAERVDHETR